LPFQPSRPAADLHIFSILATEEMQNSDVMNVNILFLGELLERPFGNAAVHVDRVRQ
jgi:hypothetical protein